MPTTLGDLVIVIPGILGSRLSRGQDEIWGLSGRTLLKAIASFGRRIDELKLPDGIGDSHPGDRIEASGLLGDLHVIPGIWSPIKGYIGLIDWLREEFQMTEVDPTGRRSAGNLYPFAYDWRLSNRYNAQLLFDKAKQYLTAWKRDSGSQDAQLILICHSMGGLVARYFLEVLGGDQMTRRVVTLGTPYRGALEALEKLVNGAPVQLGPLHFNFSQFARSLPSLYQLLPEYACVEQGGELKKVSELSIAPLDNRMLADSVLFHKQIADAINRRKAPVPYATHPVVGVKQPTKTTARLNRGLVEPLVTYQGDDEGGDGTVPRLSARPGEMDSGDARQTYCVEQHGSLILHGASRDHLWGVLTAKARTYREGPEGSDLGVSLPEVVVQGQAVDVNVTSESDRLLLSAKCTGSSGFTTARQLRNLGGGRYMASLSGLAPDIYEVRIAHSRIPVGAVKPVTGHVLVWDPAIS